MVKRKKQKKTEESVDLFANVEKPDMKDLPEGVPENVYSSIEEKHENVTWSLDPSKINSKTRWFLMTDRNDPTDKWQVKMDIFDLGKKVIVHSVESVD